MLKRAVLAGVLLVAGAPMLGSADAAPLGGLLVAVGLAVVVVPAYLGRTGRDA